MNVAEYVELRKSELDKFQADWIENMAKRPEDWPETMGEGDWFEQEIGFFDSINGGS